MRCDYGRRNCRSIDLSPGSGCDVVGVAAVVEAPELVADTAKTAVGLERVDHCACGGACCCDGDGGGGVDERTGTEMAATSAVGLTRHLDCAACTRRFAVDR